MHSHLDSVLFHETTILSRLDAMGREITRDYQGKNLTVVLILHGSLFFVADLLRRVNLPLRVTSLDVTSYHGGTQSCGTVTFNQLALPNVQGQHVLIVDDILDTGRTLAAIRGRIENECAPASVRLCVLLKKRLARDIAIDAHYIGFDIGDEFVVGYGLDYDGHYRNLPLIGTLKPEYSRHAL
ncbi:MAG: hypoxanthine phosphoribosyltransferase [Verrucomicrobiales bacterium]